MKRIALLVCFCMLLFPLVATDQSNHSGPDGAFVVSAGHTVTGGGDYCSPCGCPRSGCACDSGESPGPCTDSATPGEGKGKAPADRGGFDFGVPLLIGALALLYLVRLRTS